MATAMLLAPLHGPGSLFFPLTIYVYVYYISSQELYSGTQPDREQALCQNYQDKEYPLCRIEPSI